MKAGDKNLLATIQTAQGSWELEHFQFIEPGKEAGQKAAQSIGPSVGEDCFLVKAGGSASVSLESLKPVPALPFTGAVTLATSFATAPCPLGVLSLGPAP